MHLPLAHKQFRQSPAETTALLQLDGWILRWWFTRISYFKSPALSHISSGLFVHTIEALGGISETWYDVFQWLYATTSALILNPSYQNSYSNEISNTNRVQIDLKEMIWTSTLCRRSPVSPPLPFLLPPVGKLICSLLCELWTFLFARNTFRALTPAADAHTHPRESVLSTLNYSIFEISNNPATARPHVFDTHAGSDKARERHHFLKR